MGYFIRNLFVYGAIALVIWMLYAGIKGMKSETVSVVYDNEINDPIPNKIKMIIDTHRNVVI